MPGPGQIIANRYRLERLLGSGGMGSVWVATHLELDAEVALKFQRFPMADERFRREARAAARLRGPHVVHVYDYGFDEEMPFIAMELLSGESLRARLDREGRLGAASAVDIARQAAAALDFAHAGGVIHRDIKPSNLFLAREGTTEVLKLLDFGIAKSTTGLDGGDLTESAVVLGSAAYMSPEQARAEGIDYRTDLWSLAAVAYEMLVGTSPFRAPHLPETLNRICASEYAPLSTAFGSAARELDSVFAKAFHRERARRFDSAALFAEELARATQDLPATSASALPAMPGRAHDTVSMGASLSRTSSQTGKARRASRLAILASAAIAVGLLVFAFVRRIPRGPEAVVAGVSRPPVSAVVPPQPKPVAPAQASSAPLAFVLEPVANPPPRAVAASRARRVRAPPSLSASASASPVVSAAPAPAPSTRPAPRLHPVFGLELPSREPP